MANVPCNGCTACCKGQRIILGPDEEHGYRFEFTRRGDGLVEMMLAHKPNGDCIYLGQHGCTIHGQAPHACREFDCRKWLKGFTEEQQTLLGPLDRECVDAAHAIMELV